MFITGKLDLYIINIPIMWMFISYLGDIGFDALGQFDAGLSEELGQLVRDVLVLVQGVEQTQALQLLRDALATHLHNKHTHKHTQRRSGLVSKSVKYLFDPQIKQGLNCVV